MSMMKNKQCHGTLCCIMQMNASTVKAYLGLIITYSTENNSFTVCFLILCITTLKNTSFRNFIIMLQREIISKILSFLFWGQGEGERVVL